MLVHSIETFGRSLATPKAPTKVPTNINKLIEDEVWLAHPPVLIEVREDFDRNITLIALDPRFAEAIKELLRNSIKAIGRQRGTIWVRTQKRKSPRPCITIEIIDTGPGFPSGLSVFEPFATTDPASTGLGLAIVKEMVEGHGGTIIAKNTPAGGACVEVTLPDNLQRS
jgi:signal transduction histidine kinase